MAKKSRKARVKSRVAEPAQRPVAAAAPSAPARAAAPVSTRAARQAAAAPVAIKPVNYDYVKTDLRNIGIIAGALILIIIILAFVPALRS